mmetsp:Transcript_818/g.2169  ORF Transcript_818/g.2169 Transcript_818/m.2169 type:complete len:378 (-) Transcript_818:210-1343(-)
MNLHPDPWLGSGRLRRSRTASRLAVKRTPELSAPACAAAIGEVLAGSLQVGVGRRSRTGPRGRRRAGPGKANSKAVVEGAAPALVTTGRVARFTFRKFGTGLSFGVVKLGVGRWACGGGWSRGARSGLCGGGAAFLPLVDRVSAQIVARTGLAVLHLHAGVRLAAVGRPAVVFRGKVRLAPRGEVLVVDVAFVVLDAVLRDSAVKDLVLGLYDPCGILDDHGHAKFVRLGNERSVVVELRLKHVSAAGNPVHAAPAVSVVKAVDVVRLHGLASLGLGLLEPPDHERDHSVALANVEPSLIPIGHPAKRQGVPRGLVTLVVIAVGLDGSRRDVAHDDGVALECIELVLVNVNVDEDHIYAVRGVAAAVVKAPGQVGPR